MLRPGFIGLVLGAMLGCRGVLGIDSRPLAEVEDAGGDAAEEGGPGAPRYCDTLAPAPDFCADFDDGPIAAGWENAGRSPDPGLFGGGVIEEDLSLFRSAPRAMAVSAPPLLRASDTAAAFLLTHTAFVPTAFRLDFDLLVSTEDIRGPNGGRVLLASIHFAPAGAVVLVRDSIGTALGLLDDVAMMGKTAAVTRSLPLGTWKTITIHVANRPTDGGRDGYAKVAVDNIDAAVLALPATFQKVTAPPSVDVGVVLATGPMGSFRASFDNVRMYYLR